MAQPLRHARLDAQEIASAVNDAELAAAMVCNSRVTGLAAARAASRCR